MKNRKNLLIISYGYPPLNDAGAQRPFALAKYLDKSKYNITVITCENPSSSLGVNKDFDPSITDVSLVKIRSYVGAGSTSSLVNKKETSNIKTKIKTMVFNVGQKLMFPDKGMFWFPNVKSFLRKNKDLIQNTDVVISTSPGITNHKLARLIRRKNNDIQWVADFRDFNYVENWDGKKGLKAYLHKRLERSIVKEASALTFVTKTMQGAYQRFYPQHKDKMSYAYNGFDTDDFSKINVPLVKENVLSFFYAGSFYNGMRSPIPLMQLLDKAFEENLLNKEEVEINIAGNVDEDMKIEMQNYASYSCVKFLGSLPRTEVLKQMTKSTFLWLIVANIKSHYQTVPIKLFEYIAARRPIINFAPNVSEPTQIILDKNLGYCIDTFEFNFDESYKTFKDLILNFKEGRHKEPLSNENGLHFTWEKQIERIEKLF